MDRLLQMISSSAMGSDDIIPHINSFLENGGNINDYGTNNQTLLCKSILYQRVGLVRELLNNKDIDVNKISGYYSPETPLLCAYSWPNVDIITLLLNHPDIDINKTVPNREHPVIKAIENDVVEAIRILVKRPDFDVNMLYDGGFPILFIAIDSNRVEIVELLLTREDLDINYKHQKSNHTALHMAVYNDSWTMTKMLLMRKGIDVNVRTSDEYGGAAALHVAVQRRDTLLLQSLLDQPDIDVNIQDKDGNVPLVVVSTLRNTSKLEKIDMLFSHPNIEVNSVNNVGDNIAMSIVDHYSNIHLNKKITKFILAYIDKLIQRGIKLLLQNHEGETIADKIKLLHPKLASQLDNRIVEYVKKH